MGRPLCKLGFRVWSHGHHMSLTQELQLLKNQTTGFSQKTNNKSRKRQIPEGNGELPERAATLCQSWGFILSYLIVALHSLCFHSELKALSTQSPKKTKTTAYNNFWAFIEQLGPFWKIFLAILSVVWLKKSIMKIHVHLNNENCYLNNVIK